MPYTLFVDTTKWSRGAFDRTFRDRVASAPRDLCPLRDDPGTVIALAQEAITRAPQSGGAFPSPTDVAYANGFLLDDRSDTVHGDSAALYWTVCADDRADGTQVFCALAEGLAARYFRERVSDDGLRLLVRELVCPEHVLAMYPSGFALARGQVHAEVWLLELMHATCAVRVADNRRDTRGLPLPSERASTELPRQTVGPRVQPGASVTSLAEARQRLSKRTG